MMYSITKKILFLGAALAMLSLGACKNWVADAPQPLAVDENEVFSSEKGFREALNAVYSQMGDEDLYGKELTLGVLSLAGRNYDNITAGKTPPLYYNSAILELSNPAVKIYTARVWNKVYFAIANLNNLLDNIETRKSIFTGDNYNLFKGEALGMRAFLHFELLRLFSTTDKSSEGIPYVTKITIDNVPSGTVIDTWNSCFADLQQAEALLNENEKETSRLNKWGVKGLMARMYLYMGETEQASKLATEVINSKRFVLAPKGALDLMFADESLFNLYVYSNSFYASYKAFFGAPALIGLTTSSQQSLFGAGTPDSRRSFIDITTGLATGIPLVPKKISTFTANIFPMIRLAEMYYIAAECANDVAQGLSYINQVREARNLVELTNTEVPDAITLTNVIREEYRKEFLSEGQLFYYFKRKGTDFRNLPFYPKVPAAPNENYVPISDQASYIFVKPE